MGTGRGSQSVISDYGASSHRCGYCGNFDGFASHGMSVHSMSAYDYQDLLDRGFRRSGTYMYKPDLKTMCCPCYTIRLNAGNFQPSKAQRKVLRRLERYLAGEDLQQNGKDMEIESTSQGQTRQNTTSSASVDATAQAIVDVLRNVLKSFMDENRIPKIEYPPPVVSRPKPKQRKQLPPSTVYTCPSTFPIFSAMRRSQSTQDCSTPPKNAIELAEHISSAFNAVAKDGEAAGFVAQPTRGHINFASESGTEPRTTVEQTEAAVPEVDIVQGDGGRGCVEQNEGAQLRPRTLEITMQRSTMIEEEYELYQRYQISVHNDDPWDCSQSQYQNFLIRSPMPYVTQEDDPNAPEQGYGAFHMQYRIDGKLIAVGVVDVLPRCLSSKYLFWDPDYAFLSLGKISALKEIEWVQNASKQAADLQFYYMGFYIQSCQKMAYKAEYSPSELLCPERYCWVQVCQEVVDKIKECRYCVLSELQGAVCKPSLVACESTEDNGSDDGLDEQMIKLGNRLMQLADLRDLLRPGAEAALDGLCELIGTWRELVGRVGSTIAYRVHT